MGVYSSSPGVEVVFHTQITPHTPGPSGGNLTHVLLDPNQIRQTSTPHSDIRLN